MRTRAFRNTIIALSVLLVVAILFTSLMLVNVMTYAQGPTRNPGVYIKSHRVNVTIDNQVAVTKIEQTFVNEGGGQAEGQYLFPLPAGAAVSGLTLYINGQPIEGKILDAGQAQQVYTDIVRKMRDPVLLKYVGRGAIQANVFPIPAGEERKIEITYSHVITADNGLMNYLYSLRTDYVTSVPVREVSVGVTVKSKDPISTIYSPNPLVAINRTDEYSFRAGFEASNFKATDDFSLYYAVANKDISANLLTYRASAADDGFFMLMLTPPSTVSADKIIPKDVLIVLDQSGSMNGAKWKQAQGAVKYVLQNLNPQDRFNAVVFSSGYSLYARSLQPASEAKGAIDWVNGLDAIGGTDINSALTTALQMADKERQTVVLFLTDGLPTEGITNTKDILANVRQLANANTRIFTFGVGNDVDTFLLDSLSSSYGGTSVYVRPEENIEDRVSALYKKINSPVLTALKLNVDGPMLDDMYPAAPLPDLFAGSQLIITGRFRGEGKATITLTGKLNGETQTYTYSDLAFPSNAGGQPFVPRLWATRKIGALLNQIRLTGASPELVESVTKLSVRYGIITPYTSYLITEEDVTRRGDGGGVRSTAIPGTPKPIMSMSTMTALPTATMVSGAAAVDKAREGSNLSGADYAATTQPQKGYSGPAGQPESGGDYGGGSDTKAAETIQTVNDRTFVLRGDTWIDTQYDSAKMKVTKIIFLSDEYFKLLADHPEIKDYLALGTHVVVVIGTDVYEIAEK